MQHDWKDTISGVHVFPSSVETLVRRGEITNHHRLIAYSLSNISVKNNLNWLICVEVIVCYVSVVFSRQCTVVSSFLSEWWLIVFRYLCCRSLSNHQAVLHSDWQSVHLSCYLLSSDVSPCCPCLSPALHPCLCLCPCLGHGPCPYLCPALNPCLCPCPCSALSPFLCPSPCPALSPCPC